MIRLIGWAAVIAVGLYTGLLQVLLAMLGMVIVYAGTAMITVSSWTF